MTNKQSEQRYEIGMVGLGVMGRNLVLNMADHGFTVAGYDKDPDKVEALPAEGISRTQRLRRSVANTMRLWKGHEHGSMDNSSGGIMNVWKPVSDGVNAPLLPARFRAYGSLLKQIRAKSTISTMEDGDEEKKKNCSNCIPCCHFSVRGRKCRSRSWLTAARTQWREDVVGSCILPCASGVIRLNPNLPTEALECLRWLVEGASRTRIQETRRRRALALCHKACEA
jgi:hypothetical protein